MEGTNNHLKLKGITHSIVLPKITLDRSLGNVRVRYIKWSPASYVNIINNESHLCSLYSKYPFLWIRQETHFQTMNFLQQILLDHVYYCNLNMKTPTSMSQIQKNFVIPNIMILKFMKGYIDSWKNYLSYN